MPGNIFLCYVPFPMPGNNFLCYVPLPMPGNNFSLSGHRSMLLELNFDAMSDKTI